MTQRQSFWIILTHAFVAIVIIVCGTILVAFHDMPEAAFTGLLGFVAALLGMSGIQFSQQALNGGPKTDLTKLASIDPELARQLLAQHPSFSPPSEPPQTVPSPAQPTV